MTEARTPYSDLPDHCFWSRSHRGRMLDEIDPVVAGHFTLDPDLKIATAGSCFAQHIARHLKLAGYNYLVAEAAHPVISAEVARQFNYGTFSARYGNLYTARQMLQLAQRARGLFTPAEDVWTEGARLIDPFRPNIQPGGFSSPGEFHADRARHFAAVRRILDEADVFVFTFGLTEGWRARADGAVFPLAPGVAGGSFDPQAHEFVNFSVTEVVADFTAFVTLLREKNPTCRILMTVSPVPLIATAQAGRSVITATAYSKSVLRVACEMLEQQIANCHYFPSYEEITGIHARGAYFAKDLREVEEAGVAHVMALFMRHYTDAAPHHAAPEPATSAAEVFQAEVDRGLSIICDEELIERKPEK